MRPEYKIFAYTIVVIFIMSAIRNFNQLLGYSLFSKDVSEVIFGLSYTIPFIVSGYVIYKQSRFFWERFFCGFFLWMAISALMDELFFDPFTPQLWEHFTGLLTIIFIYRYERFKKTEP